MDSNDEVVGEGVGSSFDAKKELTPSPTTDVSKIAQMISNLSVVSTNLKRKVSSQLTRHSMKHQGKYVELIVESKAAHGHDGPNEELYDGPCQCEPFQRGKRHCHCSKCWPAGDAVVDRSDIPDSRRIVRAKRPTATGLFTSIVADVTKHETMGQSIEFWRSYGREVGMEFQDFAHRSYCVDVCEKSAPRAVLVAVLILGSAYSSFERYGDDSYLARRLYLNAFILIQCLEGRTSPRAILEKYPARDSDSVEEFFSWYPMLRHGYEHANNDKAVKLMKTVAKLASDYANKQNAVVTLADCVKCFKEPHVAFSLVTTGEAVENARVLWYSAPKSIELKWVFRAYSKTNGKSLKTTRFFIKGKPLFLSSVGKKTAEQLEIKNGSIITVSSVSSTLTSSLVDPVPKQVMTSKRGGKPSKKAKGQGQKKVTNPTNYTTTSEEDRLKQQHSKAMEVVFSECADRFKSIRERLSAMNLERMQPKSRMKQSKRRKQASASNVPQEAGAGKAGRTHIFVQVGDVANLYSSSKPLSNHNRPGSTRSATRKVISIDLHGLTGADALTMLDGALPKWIDAAMKGEHPWRVTVKIVFGGGCQILSEAVASWVRKNKQVANSPKSLIWL